MSPTPILGVRGIEKAFGGATALNGVDLDIMPGTVHALLGGNGSGKSTLTKILAGAYRADAGEIVVNGRSGEAKTWSVDDARDAGLRFVHQDPSVFPELTVAENLAIGHGFDTGGTRRIRWRTEHRQAKALLDRFGLAVDTRTPLAACSVATQAMISIIRALRDFSGDEGTGAGVLFLDEPTAALPAKEVSVLLASLRDLVSRGCTIIYITHRLPEVVEIADAVTVLRDGEVVEKLEADEITHQSLVRAIVGKELEHKAADPSVVRRRLSRQDLTPRLECRGVVGQSVKSADFQVLPGEVVALAGLLGSGRSTLLRLIAGDVRKEAGTVLMNGKEITPRHPRDAIRAGIALSPENRRESAAFMDMTVRENVSMPVSGRYFVHGAMRRRAETAAVVKILERYRVRTASSEIPISALSGGNQQKTLLSRWLSISPSLLLFDEPTQGVDVGARAEIWRLIRETVADGTASALVVLSDFEELVQECDRAIVLNKGTTGRSYDCADLTDKQLETAVLEGEVEREHG